MGSFLKSQHFIHMSHTLVVTTVRVCLFFQYSPPKYMNANRLWEEYWWNINFFKNVDLPSWKVGPFILPTDISHCIVIPNLLVFLPLVWDLCSVQNGHFVSWTWLFNKLKDRIHATCKTEPSILLFTSIPKMERFEYQ